MIHGHITLSMGRPCLARNSGLTRSIFFEMLGGLWTFRAMKLLRFWPLMCQFLTAWLCTGNKKNETEKQWNWYPWNCTPVISPSRTSTAPISMISSSLANPVVSVSNTMIRKWRNFFILFEDFSERRISSRKRSWASKSLSKMTVFASYLCYISSLIFDSTYFANHP